MRRAARQRRHHRGGDDGREQQEPVGVEPGAQTRQQHGAADRAGTDRPEQNAVEAGAAAEQVARDQRQQGPDRAGTGEEDRGPQQHDMQFAARLGVAQAGPEGAGEALAQCIVGALRAPPPDQRADDDDVAQHVGAIGEARAQGGED